MAGAAGLPLSPPQTIGGRRVDNLKEKVVIAVSSRALFDLEEEHALFEEKGYKAFRDHQVRYQNTPLRPGVAFPFVRRLLALNELYFISKSESLASRF